MSGLHEIRRASLLDIEQVWQQRWSLPIVTMRGDHLPAGVEGLELVSTAGGELLGLVTFTMLGDLTEVVSLDALVTGRGHGSCLLAAAEEELRRRQVRGVVLTTTNDNLRAQQFYLRRGYRLVRLELDGMARVRAIKPCVGLFGAQGLPLRDMWELEKELT